jgi:hypothetical protein
MMALLVFFSAIPSACKENGFLFLPPWWEFLRDKLTADPIGGCSINFAFPNDIWAVGLAVLDMLLRIAGFVAVVSIIIAGFQHQFTGGSPDKAATARRRIYNSLIGLGIALTATALVTFLGHQLAK